MMRLIILCVALYVPQSLHAWFSYDRAAYAAQREQWQQAMHCMKQMVNTQPNNPHVLYDAGVAAYRNKDFSQAQAYFHQAATLCSAEQQVLQEQAYFNEGNAYAHLQRYQEAIASYEKVLMLDADDQRAHDNIALLKKLLEQQQQEQQKDKQREQQQKQEQDKQKKNNEQQQKNQDEAQQQEQQGGSQEQNEKDQHNEQCEDNQKQQQESRATEQQEQREQQQQSDDKSQQQVPEHQKQQQSAAQQKQQQAVQQERENNAPACAEHAPQEVSSWLDTLLSEREKQDEAGNKALIKAQTAQQSKGSHNAGAHNW